MLQSLLARLANRSQGASGGLSAPPENPEQGPGSGTESDRVRVLSLSANPTATFYERQVSALEECGVECTTIGPPPYEHGNDRSPQQYLRLWVEMLRELSTGYDVVHANYGLVGPIALAQSNCPVVMTLWGTDVMSSGWVASVSKVTARYCDVVVAPSRRLAETVPGESHVIQFGVDTELFQPIPRGAARERLGWDEDATIVLFPYGNRDVKNYPRAKRVVDRLHGDVELRRVSSVAHEEMPLYYNASDALVVTSDREAGPMTVKEAAACNVPVVSTDVGFADELLADIRNSYVAESESAFVERLEEVLRSDEEPNGRAAILGEQSMGKQLRSLYEEAI